MAIDETPHTAPTDARAGVLTAEQLRKHIHNAFPAHADVLALGGHIDALTAQLRAAEERERTLLEALRGAETALNTIYRNLRSLSLRAAHDYNSLGMVTSLTLDAEGLFAVQSQLDVIRAEIGNAALAATPQRAADDGQSAQEAYEEACREAAAERPVRVTWWGGR